MQELIKNNERDIGLLIFLSKAKPRIKQGGNISAEFEILLAAHNMSTDLDFEHSKTITRAGFEEIVERKVDKNTLVNN